MTNPLRPRDSDTVYVAPDPRDARDRERYLLTLERGLPAAGEIGPYAYCSADNLPDGELISLKGAVAVYEQGELRALVFGPTPKLDANLFITGRASGSES